MNLGKKVFVLGFLIIILIGVFAIQNEGLSEGLLSFMKTKLIGLGPELNLTEQDSGLDFTEINLDNFSKKEVVKETVSVIENVAIIEEVIEEPVIEDMEGIGGPIPFEIIKEEVTLEEIEKELERITFEIEQLIEEIQILINNNSL